MKLIKAISILVFLLITNTMIGQTKISGKVLSKDGEALVGVNISVQDTYDGTITDLNGAFTFETEDVDRKALAVSYIGYNTQLVSLDQKSTENLLIELRESVTSLNSVTITAGAFAADDKQRASVLEPLDIYTTAGSLGDINGALKTLPGTQIASDDGRLLVRGGEASETRVFVDGLLAAKPYYSKVPDLPTRGRFAPSLFSGTVFSTGGYSAEYGQALSSVLVLESSSVEVEEVTGVSLMSIGGELSRTWCANNRSTSLGVSYTNMAPYYGLVNNRLDWTKPTEAAGLNFMHRQKFKNGAMLKVFSTADYGLSAFNTLIGDQNTTIDNEGGNVYLNISYSQPLGDNSVLKSGVASTFDNQRQMAGVHKTRDEEFNVEGRLSLVHHISDGISLNAGIADAYTDYGHLYNRLESDQVWTGNVNDHVLSVFAEPEIKLSSKFALRPGLRYEYSTYLHQSSLSPRFSAAYRTSKNSQLSMAYGQYYQNPVNEYLKFGDTFSFEKATHYILSFQTGTLKERLLRLEAYHKDYDQLVRYDRGLHPYDMSFDNTGKGYARGLDVFFRDRKSIKSTDYWVSYSYIDTKRLYQDFPKQVTPAFIAEHTFSAVTKYFIGAINTQIGATWTTASGRPYHRPGDGDFMSQKAPVYNNLNLNLSYLTHIADHFTIVHFSFSNVLGNDQLTGYQTIPGYAGAEDILMPLMPDIKQFLFLGIFISIK